MISQQQVTDAIARVDLNYIRGTTSVVCALILTNGHVVIGQAHCAPGTAFDPMVGAQFARQDAESKVAELLAFEARGPLNTNS